MAPELDRSEPSAPAPESSGDSGSLPDQASGADQHHHRVYPESLPTEHLRCIRYRPRGSLSPFAAPLAKLINRQSFHGHDLVMAVGCPDNVARAEDAIRRAERVGWIERGKYQPSREQLFFGIGGFPGDRLGRLEEQYRSPVAHHWITKTFTWLDESAVDAALQALP